MSQTPTFQKAVVHKHAVAITAMPSADFSTDKLVETLPGALYVMPETSKEKRRKFVSCAAGVLAGALLLTGLYTSQQASRQFDFLAAVRVGDTAKVREFIRTGASVEGIGVNGKRPLEVAAFHGRMNVARLLLAQKADPSPAMDEAALQGHYPLLHLLIDQGAEVGAERGGILLCSAAQSGSKDTLNLLIRNGANVNTPNPQEDNMTPLMYAARNSVSGVVFDLLAAGAKVNATSEAGQTPLMFAAAWNEPAASKYLLNAGAKVNAQDKKGQTPLMLGVLGGNIGAVKYLLACGAKINVKDNRGKSALTHAVETGNAKLAKILRSQGAK